MNEEETTKPESITIADLVKLLGHVENLTRGLKRALLSMDQDQIVDIEPPINGGQVRGKSCTHELA